MDKGMDTSLQKEICIVGAGPAGINAAILLAGKGVKSVVLDEAAKIGGAVYRRPLRSNAMASHLAPKIKKEIETFHKIFKQHQNHIKLLEKTQVLGSIALPDQLALYNKKRGVFSLRYKKLLICTGCYEQTVHFPGWTLPGVMTAGGLQLQVKNGLVRPAESVALVGSGPLLLVVARQLHSAGVRVTGVWEREKRSAYLRNIAVLTRNISLTMEGIDHLRYLRKAGIPVYYGWGIVEARGKSSLEEVVVAPYGNGQKPIYQKARTLNVQALGIGYGFNSRSRLAQLLGVKTKRTHESGVYPIIDEWGRTSIQDIYAAGDVAGVHGSKVAAEEGKIAALAMLKDMKLLEAKEATREFRRMRKKADKLIGFRQAFQKNSAETQKRLIRLAGKETVICACENVRRSEIDQAMERGVRDLTTLKMETRIGMGDCQGKRCGEFCHSYLKEKLRQEDIGELRPRFPLSLVPFAAITKGENP